MANVLNEFLHGVSKGFQDAAFASFSRRRSTVREDISQSFGSGEESPKNADSAYLDMVGSAGSAVSAAAESSPAPKAIAAPKRGRKAGGVVDAKPRKRGRKAGSRNRGGDSGLREI
jgi:hypothetical protein